MPFVNIDKQLQRDVDKNKKAREAKAMDKKVQDLLDEVLGSNEKNKMKLSDGPINPYVTQGMKHNPDLNILDPDNTFDSEDETNKPKVIKGVVQKSYIQRKGDLDL